MMTHRLLLDARTGERFRGEQESVGSAGSAFQNQASAPPYRL